MLKILLLTIALWGLTLTTDARAEIYRCRTPDGRIVMTDQPAEVPTDCTMIDTKVGQGSFNIMPAQKEGRVSSPAEQSVADTTAAADPSPLHNQATSLVQHYQEAVKKRYRSSLVADQRRAIQDIVTLKAQKQQLLGDLAVSSLSRDEKQTIRKILEKIPR